MSKKKKKSNSVMKCLRETKISLICGTLILVLQAIIILNYVPSAEVEGVSVLDANVNALLDMIFS
jgi:hypothetical protein